MSSKRFRIALSFAGEKRDFVAQVAGILADQFTPEAILYDKYHEAEFARRRLGFHLPDLYYKESDLIVAVFCRDYERKEWCGLEWDAIFALLMEGKEELVLLSRFDHAMVKGIYAGTGFMELDDKSPERAAMLILERLALNEQKPKNYYYANPKLLSGGKRDGKRAAASTTSALIAPPSNSHALPPNNLPRLSSFFGRDAELRIIADALAPEARTWGALIDGPGGMGKTSLAIRAAERIPPGLFRRILFLSAKERELSADGERALTGFVLPGYLEMLNEIARLLGKTELTKGPENERANQLLVALQSEHALLILDNLETLTPEHRGQLFIFLGRLPQGCKGIVTSRRRTDIDARIIRLDKLDRDAALAFLEELAIDRPLLARARDAERLTLYEETGGNPLLLRWAAGQLGRGKCKTLAAALEFLRSAPLDNDPLEFIFGDLLNSFTESETKVLAALAHFPTAVHVTFIAELSGISQTASQTALDDLSNRALVVPDAEERSFALMPLVADFIRRQRPEAVQETSERLANRAYTLILANGGDNYERFGWLESEWPTLSPALPIFVAGSNERLQIVCNALKHFLDFNGRWDERLALSLKAEDRAVGVNDFLNAGWRAFDSGWGHYRRHQLDELLKCNTRVKEHWSKAQKGAEEWADELRLDGVADELRGNYALAISAFREALKYQRKNSPNSVAYVKSLNDLAEAERLSGGLNDAENHYIEALEIAKIIGYRAGLPFLMYNLADVSLKRPDFIGAEKWARKALSVSEDIGRKEAIAVSCQILAHCLAQQGKVDGLPYAQRAVELYTALGLSNLEEARATLAECKLMVAPTSFM